MSFTIEFDYRFDRTGFFDDPDRRAALEAAAAQWEAVIQDEFDDIPAGSQFSIRSPSSDRREQITLAKSIDDILVFVGAEALSGTTLAYAGPSGLDIAGDIYDTRIHPDFRGTGPVTDFEPWVGTITFDTSSTWSFDLNAPIPNAADFLSVAIHEIGHILGIGSAEVFTSQITAQGFAGPNSIAVNGGNPIPIDPDGAHIEEGFSDDNTSLDGSLTIGSRVLPSVHDQAILADIGYEIAGFSKVGTTPSLATQSSERIFGREVDDVIDALGGDDTLQGDGGADLLRGNSGSDDLFGQSGDDTLRGGTGDDYLGGGSGNDVLDGGPGVDVLFGEAGQDIFEIRAGDGQNTVSDFDLSSERIRLVNSGFDNVQDAVAAITKTASNVSQLTLPDGTTVKVFHASQFGSPLTASHFEVVNGDVEQSSGFEAASPDSSGSDAVTTPEDDVVVITSDMSSVDGLEGTDTAVLTGDQEDYTVTFSPDGVTVTDRSDGGVGPAELTNFEFLDFDTELAVFGGPMDLAQFGSHTGLNAAEFEAFVEMYIAYFNRAPDAVGLAFWGSAFANGNTMEEIAEMFADQPETLATYPADSSNIKFVSDVYQNVLGRAPDIDGLRFWTGQLDDGNTGRGEFILAMLNGVEDGSADRAYLDQKTDIGAYFSVQKGMSNTDDATQVMALFDGTDNSVQTAVDTIDALYDASMSSQNGDFLMPLVGVLDDPFAV